MPEILENISLKAYNTFGIEAGARYFVRLSSAGELISVLQDPQMKSQPRIILGGGSNILFTGDFEGLVIKNELLGIDRVKEDDAYVYIKACSGEVWHNLVLYALEHNLGGIENLSLIPGTVGAAPMQNIGAYGVEVREVFHSLEALDMETLQLRTFTNEECHFGYRDSYFKQEGKGRYFILSVTLRLSKNPGFNISYGAIGDTLKEMGIEELSIQAISKAVCHIRSSKLPDPANIGNAGSFFKNPEISSEQYEALKTAFPAMPGYTADGAKVKVPAGWLIEQCGWKGKRLGNTGSHKDQALVLVNYGGAGGQEIYSLAMQIQKSVSDKFGIEISPEVNVI